MGYGNAPGFAIVQMGQAQAKKNTVMAGFADEGDLIKDSENQRNIDMNELKDLLLWTYLNLNIY